METKTCTKCGAAKVLGEFYTKAAGRRDTQCKACRTAYTHANKDRINAQRRARYAKNPAAVRKQNNAYRAKNLAKESARRRLNKFGTDGADLFAGQQGKCAICGRDLTALPPRKRHLDHCHESGVVRAWLCHWCNTGLGQFSDSSSLLRAAADYVASFEVLK